MAISYTETEVLKGYGTIYIPIESETLVMGPRNEYLEKLNK